MIYICMCVGYKEIYECPSDSASKHPHTTENGHQQQRIDHVNDPSALSPHRGGQYEHQSSNKHDQW